MHISRHFSDVDECLTLANQDEIQKVVDILDAVRTAQGSVWIAGNGGSAATAAHFANDLSKMARIRAYSVADMTPTILAHGNDNGWDRMFSGAAGVYVTRQDALIGISCSGNSQNVIDFMKLPARFRIGMTGPSSSRISDLGLDALVRGMSDEITVIEDFHLIVCHAITRALCH